MCVIKKIYVIFLVIALSSYCKQMTLANSIGVTKEIKDSSQNVLSVSRSNSQGSDVTYARIHCDYEEPTEADVCQQHCLPKGYSYGICVSYACSCI